MIMKSFLLISNYLKDYSKMFPDSEKEVAEINKALSIIASAINQMKEFYDLHQD